MAARQRGWWEPDKLTGESGPSAERLCEAFTQAWQDDVRRRNNLLAFSRLYLNRAIGGLGPDTYNNFDEGWASKVRLNLIRNMSDAIQARIAKNRPKATAITERGDFGLQQKARRLDKFLWGIFYREQAYRLGPKIFRDGMAWGDGLVKVSGEVEKTPDGKRIGRIRYYRTFPHTVLVDAHEAYAGRPRTLYQIHDIDRGVLKALYPKQAGFIEDAASEPIVDGFVGSTSSVLADRLQVVEAWRLPSAPGADDGWHVTTLKGGLLGKARKWKHMRFPFAHYQWADAMFGYWGQGLAETAASVHDEVNELAQKIQAALYHNSRTITVIGPDVDESQLDNDLKGNVIKTTGPVGQSVQVYSPNVVNGEVYNHLMRMISLGYQFEGVSELSVASKKPAGLDSGRALREFNDIESERFIIRGQDYEGWFLDLGALTVMTARDLHEEEGVDIEVTATDRRFRSRFLDRLKWSQVSLEDDKFELKIFASASLPQTPAGKQAAIEGLIGARMLTPEEGMELLDLPDLDAVMARKLAPYELVIEQIETIIEDGEIIPPEPYQDLKLAKSVAQHAYLRAKLDRVPPERLSLIQQFIAGCEDLLETAARELAQQQAAAGAVPGAPAGAPPSPQQPQAPPTGAA